MKNTICVLFHFLFLFASLNVFGQGWERYFGTAGNIEIITGITQTTDGGYLLAMAGAANGEGVLIKISPGGLEEWSQPLNSAINPNVIQSATGNYFIAGTRNAADEPVLIAVDLQGNKLWEQLSFATDPQAWVALPDGFVSFFVFEPGEVTLNKVNLQGELLWDKTATINGFVPGGGIAPTADGGFALGGHNGGDALVAKFNGEGELEWWEESGSPEIESGNGAIAQTSDGGYVVTNDLSGPEQLPSITKFSATGAFEWNTIFQPALGNGTYYVSKIMEDANGDLVMAGRTEDVFTQAYLMKYTGSGQFEFLKTYNGRRFNRLLLTSEGFYAAAGQSYFDLNNGDGYVILTDANGSTFPNLIQGQLAVDEDLDCLVSTGDQLLAGWTVRAQGAFTTYDLTDENGQYALSIDTGDYTLEIFPPNDLWSPCENPIDLSLGLGDTLTVDFPVQAAIDCPAMQVDISRPFLRRCFDNHLVVQYCNLGTVPAEGATIEVTLDSLLEFQSSTLAPSGQTGLTYTFDLGTLGVNDCGSFIVTALVSCEAELGQTLCFEAHAFPDTICGVPFNWSGASMEARAYCEGDSTVVLEVENVGSVPTSEPMKYIVIEDQIIFFEDEQVFDPAEVWTFSEAANGATWRVISEQEPNHPGFSFPTAFVEGCGENEVGTFSIGFLNEHPMADGNGFIDIDCEEVVGAYDPNDKTGFPSGYGEEHFIEPNTDIEYRIRFQNTGTDTAFTVVIRDTLPPQLDPTTLRPGASSHHYEFDLQGNGIAVFTFPNIMLPDSNVNEPLSHGFVSFKISQVPDLEPGEVIHNSAAIFFDFNEPIITNTTLHTIERDFIITASAETTLPNVEVKIYPNPFAQQATFEVDGLENQQLTLKLYDGMGRLVRRENFAGGQLVFQRDGLRDGFWFFQIEANGVPVASGKLVVARR